MEAHLVGRSELRHHMRVTSYDGMHSTLRNNAQLNSASRRPMQAQSDEACYIFDLYSGSASPAVSWLIAM